MADEQPNWKDTPHAAIVCKLDQDQTHGRREITTNTMPNDVTVKVSTKRNVSGTDICIAPAFLFLIGN